MPYKDKEQAREYMRKYRTRMTDEQKKKARKKNSERKVELREWMTEIKSEMSCSICGEDHRACLEFHHEDPDAKEFNIGSSTTYGYGKERILEEIKKCTCLCSNCHRKLHWDERRE